MGSLLVSAALTGHARTSSLPLPNLMVALVHVTAAAAWVGGLFMLVAVALPAVRDQADGNRAALLAPVVSRFSDLALWSVFAVVASGTYSAWMAMGEARAVTGSTYGLVFLAKLSAFLPVLALGGVNNRWTKPRLVRAAREETSGTRALVVLRRLVALEIALVAVVLAFTVFLLQLSTPASQAVTP
jgi:putative copper export protein